MAWSRTYKWKRTFDILELDAEGTLHNTWWAMVDGFVNAAVHPAAQEPSGLPETPEELGCGVEVTKHVEVRLKT